MWPRVLRFGWEWALVGQGAALVGSLLGRVWWPLDLLNVLAPGWAALAAVGALAAVAARAWAPAGALGVALVLHVGRLAPERGSTGGHDGERVRIAVANVYTANPDHTSLLEWLRREDPDVIGLLEVNDAWIADLSPLREGRPYDVVIPRPDNFGVALFSRVPLELRVEQLAAAPVPTVVAERTDPGGGRARLVLTHPLPPIGAEYAAHRDEQLAAVARLRDARTVVIGDLNAPPWSAAFPGPSPGWRPGTWPAFFPALLRIPIDHVLVGSDIRLDRLEVGPDVGSDHRPLVAEIVLP